MGNPKFGIAFVRYDGFNKLDKSERAEIESIVALKIKKIKRVSDILSLRLHYKVLHEKQTEITRQGPISQIDAVLETRQGHFYTKTQDRNPYHAIEDALENLLKQVKHKHPHKEEWKEAFKKPRKLKKGRKT